MSTFANLMKDVARTQAAIAQMTRITTIERDAFATIKAVQDVPVFQAMNAMVELAKPIRRLQDDFMVPGIADDLAKLTRSVDTSALASVTNMISREMNTAIELTEPIRQLQSDMRQIVQSIDTSAFATMTKMIDREMRTFRTSFNVILRDMPRYACERALRAAFEGDQEELEVFVTEWIGWPAEKFSMAVLEVLVEGYWREADDPIRYIRVVASRKAKQLARLEQYGYLKPKLIEKHTVWLPHGQVRLLRDSHNPFMSVEQRCDRELALYRAGASEDVIRIDRIRMMDITRANAAEKLGWDRRRVEAAWRQHGRVMKRVGSDLHPYIPPF